MKEGGWLRIEKIKTDYTPQIDTFRLSVSRCANINVAPLRDFTDSFDLEVKHGSLFHSVSPY